MRGEKRRSATTRPRVRSGPRQPTSWPKPSNAEGEADEAIAVFRDLERLRPKNGRHLGCLARVLIAQGRDERGCPSAGARPWLC